MLSLPVTLPPTVLPDAARFALATGLIYQGGGVVTVAQAAEIAGMSEREFAQAASALGEEMEEMLQQAYDSETRRLALEETERAGGETLSFEEVCESLGIIPAGL